MPPIVDHASLPKEQIAFLKRTFGPFTMLSQVLDWGRKQNPAVVIEEVITMDEYTHDVLMKLNDGSYLAFDAT